MNSDNICGVCKYWVDLFCTNKNFCTMVRQAAWPECVPTNHSFSCCYHELKNEGCAEAWIKHKAWMAESKVYHYAGCVGCFEAGWEAKGDHDRK